MTSSLVDTCLSFVGLQRISVIASNATTIMSTVTTSRNQLAGTSGVGALLYKWLWNGQYSIFPFIPKPSTLFSFSLGCRTPRLTLYASQSNTSRSCSWCSTPKAGHSYGTVRRHTSILARKGRLTSSPWSSVKLWWPAIWGHIQARRKGLKPYYWSLGLFTTEDRKNPKVQPLIAKDPFKGDRFVDHTKVVSKKKCHAYYDDCESPVVVVRVKLRWVDRLLCLLCS